MKLSYDLDAGALYISLSEEPVHRTEDVDAVTLVDLDLAGRVRGIEMTAAGMPLPLSRIYANYQVSDSDLAQLRAYFTVIGAGFPDSAAYPVPELNAGLVAASVSA